MTNQGVDIWHAGPVAAFVEEEVVRWLCDLVGYGPGSFGLLTSGGVMANFMGMTIARDLHLGRRLGLGAPPRGRDLEGARVYASDQTHFSVARALDLLGLPGRDARHRPVRRRLPPARRAGRGGRRAGPGRRPDAVRDRGGRRVDEHRVGRCHRRARRRRRDARPVAPRRCGLRRRGPPVRGATPGACRTSSAPTRSRSTRTSGSSRPTTSAACWSATGRTWPRPSAAAAPSTTAAARRRPRPEPTDAAPDDDHDDHGDQLNFYKLSFEGTRRWRALKLWMSWKHLGTDGFGRLIEANDDLAAHLARRCAEADDFEALPEVPSLSVVCFRHLPGGRAAALALPPGELDAHQDRLQRALEVLGRRLADHDPAARRDLPARRHRQLPLDRGRHRPAPRGAAPPRLGCAAGSGPAARRCSRPDRAALGGRLLDRRAARRARGTRSAPEARAGRSSRIASIMSARPMPRPPSPIGAQRHVLPAVAVDPVPADVPVEPVRVAQLERPARAVDLDVRRRARHDVERRHEPADRPRREGERGDDRRRRLDRERLAGPRARSRSGAPRRRRARRPRPSAIGPRRWTSAAT